MKNEFRKVRLLSQCQVAGRAGFQPRLCCCSVTKSRLTLWDPMDFSTPGFPVLLYLLEFAQTHVHWVGDAIQPSHLLLPLLLPSIFPSIRVFTNESALHIRWPKYWSFSFNFSLFNEYWGFISFRINWFDLLAVVFPILLFSSISLRWSLKKAFLSLLAIDYKKFWFWLNLA